MAIRRLSRQPLLAVVIVALAGCAGEVTEPSIGGLSIVQEAPVRAVPGWILRDTLTVRLVNATGQPRSGARVTWTVRVGGGSIAPIQSTTDTDGLARAVWTLGPHVGPNEVMARASDQFAVTFNTIGQAFRADRLAAGVFMGCGLVDAAVWCWGNDFWIHTEPVSEPPNPLYGWTATGVPGRVDGPGGFLEIAVSGPTVCGLDTSSAVWCATESAPTLTHRTDLPPLWRLTGASWGWGDYCGLATADSTAWCWPTRSAGAAAAVPGSPAFVDLDIDGADNAGPNRGFLACGTLTDSTAACWGSGSLGNGSGTGSASPVAVSGGHRFAEVAVGEMFACGRRSDWEVWCWGRNHRGQLGAPGADAPTPVLARTGIVHITASEDIVLALPVGRIVRWGGGGWFTPGPIPSLAGLPIADLAARSAECISVVDGQVYCIDEMWDSSTPWRIGTYSPVHPIVSPP